MIGENLESAGQVEPTIPHAVVSSVVDGLSPVRAWREYLKFTQLEVADKLGVSQSAYAQMENPQGNPRHKTIKRIALALGIVEGQLEI